MLGAAAAIASIVWIASFAAHKRRIIKLRATDGLSPVTRALAVVAFGLWLVFGILGSDWALIVPSVVGLAVSLPIVATMRASQRGQDDLADRIEMIVAGDRVG